MGRVPIVSVGDALIAAVQEELRDSDALTLQEELAERLTTSTSHGVLLDLSTVDTVDSFLGRLIHDIARVTRLLGAPTVVVGLQPAVAVTLVELGLEMRGLRTALNTTKGLALLQRMVAQEQPGKRR